MELDHIFLFTEVPEQAVKLLQQFGLKEGTSNIHPGQGTACRRFFFHNAYLELVWVTNEQEIKSSITSETKLWERSNSRITNYCPFGLCFRSQEPINSHTALFEDALHYKPLYMPQELYINVASNGDFHTEPMLFEFPFPSGAPEDYPTERRQPLNHERGFQEITCVTLTLPTAANRLSGAMQKVIHNSCVRLLEGEHYSAALEFDKGAQGKTKSFKDALPLTFLW
jgi:hypothetical protein